MREMHTAVNVKKGEVKVLQDKVSYYKYEKDLMEGELENKKEEIKDLIERNKSLQNMEQSNKSEWENKLMKLEEELKAKEK